MTQTKATLAHHLTARTDGLNLKVAAAAVQATFDLVKAALVAGESVLISGFGKFALRDKRQRAGRDPRSGISLTIAARRVVTFKPSEVLKAAMRRPRARHRRRPGGLR